MSLEIVLITGMSGSGKSVALHALEDAGYYCVDNLPPELLSAFVELEHGRHSNKVAIAMDARSAGGLPHLPGQLERLQRQGVVPHLVFLDATTGTLVRRFSETRRRHPLSQGPVAEGRRALVQDIETERELLGDLRGTHRAQITVGNQLMPACDGTCITRGHHAKIIYRFIRMDW